MEKKKSITVDQFYEFITQHMTPEEALKKLLRSTVEQYDQMRELEGQQGSPYMIIAMAACELNWSIGLEDNVNPHDHVRGLVLGMPDYINAVADNVIKIKQYAQRDRVTITKERKSEVPGEKTEASDTGEGSV